MQQEIKQAISIDPQEVDKFASIAQEWWDENGKFKPLHRINPVRIGYIRDRAVAHFALDDSNLKPLSGMKLLDVGCGGGLICEPMARLGADVTGIDASEKNIRVAALHAENMGLDINYRAISAEAMAQQKKQFDIVLALEILEHVADIPAFITATAKLVKPGGLLFLSTLNRTAKSFAMAIVGAEYLLRWLPRGTHDWKKFIKPHELHNHLRSCGLQVSDQKGMVINPLNGQWQLSDNDLDVNYLLTAEKPSGK